MRVDFCLFSVQFTVALLIFSDVILQSSSVNLKELFTPENEELLLIMKEELEKFQIDMTKNFMQKHSRRKRGKLTCNLRVRGLKRFKSCTHT